VARGKWKQPRKTSSLWTEFEQVYPIGYDDKPIEMGAGESWWKNSFYTVLKKDLDDGSVRLSIKHNQNKAIREWKHLQRIKNELVGAEREAVEIFPPESMLTSLDNQHHLFVTPEGVSSIYVYEEKMRQQNA
jgi:hypothetical protein